MVLKADKYTSEVLVMLYNVFSFLQKTYNFYKPFLLAFVVGFSFCFSVGAMMFPPGNGVNCALPLYMQALQAGYGQGPSEASLRKKQERKIEKLEAIEKALER